MRRTTGVLAAVALVAVAVGLTWLIAGTSGAETTQISVYETEPKGYAVPLQKVADRFTAGDSILEHRPVFDTRTDAKKGETVTRSTVMRVFGDDPLLYIDCEATLPVGTIVFAGAGRLSELTMARGLLLEISGGTGTYRAARGTVTVKAGKQGRLDVYDLTFDVAS
jgi:hypothetical protein